MRPRLLRELERAHYTLDERIERIRMENMLGVALIPWLSFTLLTIFGDILNFDLSFELRYSILRVSINSFHASFTLLNCIRGSMLNSWIDKIMLLFLVVTVPVSAIANYPLLRSWIALVVPRYPEVAAPFVFIGILLYPWLLHRLLLTLYFWGLRRVEE